MFTQDFNEVMLFLTNEHHDPSDFLQRLQVDTSLKKLYESMKTDLWQLKRCSPKMDEQQTNNLLAAIHSLDTTVV